MTPRKLIEEIIDLYGEARKSNYPNDRITRSKSHSISSKVEDLFAYFISDYTEDKLIIDRPYRIEIDKKKLTFAPDITTINDTGVITNFFDVKMDLGWKRDGFSDYCRERAKLISRIRGSEISHKNKPHRVAQAVKYNIVVVSELNISMKKLQSHMEKIQEQSVKNFVNVFFLTGGNHPNEWVLEDTKANIKIYESEFEEIIQILRQ